MQIADSVETPGSVTVVGPSLALEISWAVHSAWSPRLRAQHPILEEVAEAHPELFRRLQEFWNDDGHCFAELEVMAYLTDTLGESELDSLFDAMATARDRIPLDLPLRSETPEMRDTINSRLSQLKSDDQRWLDYRALLSALYEPLDEWWRTVGIPTAEHAVASTRRAIDQGGEWRRMVSYDCVEVNGHIAELSESDVSIILAPCALFGRGLYLDLPGHQLFGVGAGLGELGARTRTEDLAKSIRVLADPTRLAILDHLRAGERSIGELALDFDLAQPTVSVHVKQLRQAGLVTATRKGPRLELSVNAEAVSALAQRLTTLVDH
jgi:DNA-binding transcriptional ArsR family regulator